MQYRLLLLSGLSTLLAVGSARADFSFTSGHGDIGLGEGQELELHLHVHEEGEEGQEYPPDQAEIVVPYSTYSYISSNGGRASGSVWDSIGVAAGESYYYLPATNAGASGATALSAPYLGIGAEEVELGYFDDDTLTLTLVSAVMPDGATFSLWEDSLEDPTFYMTTYDGISNADAVSLNIASSDHVHYNWGFSEAGTYELTFTVSAYVDGELVTDTNTYTFVVVPEPATTAVLSGSAVLALVLLLRLRRRQGWRA